MLNRSLGLSLLALPLVAASLQAQAVVTGTVYDSVGRKPLAGALVQLVSDSNRTARSVQTDSLGVYSIKSVPSGSYIIGFFHATLDSLGLDLSPKAVAIAEDAERRVDLAIPAPRTIVKQLCPASVNRDSTGLLLGHLRDADSRMPRSGTVTVLWMELLIGQGGIQRNRQQVPIKSDSAGWFAMCGLP